MKSVVNQPKEEKKEKPFPKLMISKISKNIVFFEREMIGQVLKSNISQWYDGEIANGFDMGNFEDFNGSITLSND